MSHFVIYDSPFDFPPGTIVVREWEIRAGGLIARDAVTYASIQEARAPLFKTGLTCMPALPGDDPVIVEVWI